MIANLIVIAFVVGLAFMWSTQGLFSALVHLGMTIIAGVLAFAVWEPLVLGFLIERMPETAWGVGLLAPFSLLLLLLRVASDKLVPGNVDLPHVANMIGGGVVGLISGVITGGVVVIGLQYIGGVSLGYASWRVAADGGVQQTQSLWVPADRIAAQLFTMLSDGSMTPALSSRNLATHRPNLAQEAGLFGAVARAHARQSLRPASAEVDRRFTFSANEAPAGSTVTGDELGLIIGVDINLALASDADGVFTASAGQAALVCQDAAGNPAVVFPTGWVYRTRNAFGLFASPEDFIRTKPVQRAAIDLLFKISARHEPMYLRLKNTRLELPREPTFNADQIDQWLGQVDWASTGATDGPTTGGSDGPTDVGPTQGVGADVEAVDIRVSAKLPHVYNLNQIRANCRNAQLQRMDPSVVSIVRAHGAVAPERSRISESLAVTHIYHTERTDVVRVTLAQAKAKSLYGKAFEAAAAVATGPVLKDNESDLYRPIGYMINRVGQTVFAIDPAEPIHRLAQIDREQLATADELILLFIVPKGVTITEFSFSGRTGKQAVDLQVR